jgi:hypothetical protein
MKMLNVVKHFDPTVIFMRKVGAYLSGAPGRLKLELERIYMDGNA